MPKRVVLKDKKILDSWSLLIENAQDKKEDIYRRVSEFLKDSDVPGIKTEMVKVSPGGLGGVFSKHRDYLMISNEALKDYKIYIGARSYGKNLDVSWYLCCEPGIFKSTLSSFLTRGASDKALSFMLNVFQQQDLLAYTTLVHHCLLKAVEEIMMGLGQDFSKIDRKSRGFLGIS